MSVPGRVSAFLLACLCFVSRASAGELPPKQDVERVRAEVFARPEFHYVEPEGPTLIDRIFGGFMEWVFRMRNLYPILFWAVIAAMVAVLVLLIAHIVWTIRVAGRAVTEEDDDLELDQAVRRADPSPFRSRALSHAAAGRMDDAIRDLYMALLLALSGRGSIRYARSKALLDYRLEAAQDPAAYRLLQTFGPRYHPGSFGRKPPTSDEFAELVAALDEVMA